jgi:hypothetical protein
MSSRKGVGYRKDAETAEEGERGSRRNAYNEMRRL